MRSEKFKRRAQYCVAAGCQTDAKGPLRMDMSDILFSEGQNSDDNHPIKVSPGYSSRGHSVDIQSLISTFLEEEKESDNDNARSDDSIYVTANDSRPLTVDSNEENSREDDKDDIISVTTLKLIQHSRGLTEGYSHVPLHNDILPRGGSEKKYSRIQVSDIHENMSF
jgi:hypothetical protein